MRRALVVVGGVLLVSACGGGSSSPTTPSTPAQQNRAPTVSGITVTPTFGIQDFAVYTFNAAATDADGDPLSYAWTIAGQTASGQNVQIGPFRTGGIGTASVTVSDGRGATGTSSVQFIVGTMTGTWDGAVPGTPLPSFRMELEQVSGLFAGNIFTSRGERGEVGPTGALATIDGGGRVVMRIKVAPFTDFTMTGQMDGTGARVTGSVSGSGFKGQAFVMTKR